MGHTSTQTTVERSDILQILHWMLFSAKSAWALTLLHIGTLESSLDSLVAWWSKSCSRPLLWKWKSVLLLIVMVIVNFSYSSFLKARTLPKLGGIPSLLFHFALRATLSVEVPDLGHRSFYHKPAFYLYKELFKVEPEFQCNTSALWRRCLGVNACLFLLEGQME